MTSKWARWRLKSPASRLFTQPFIQTQIKENIKAPRHWPLCVWNSPGTGEFPAQMASYAEYVSISWRHHAFTSILFLCFFLLAIHTYHHICLIYVYQYLWKLCLTCEIEFDGLQLVAWIFFERHDKENSLNISLTSKTCCHCSQQRTLLCWIVCDMYLMLASCYFFYCAFS